MALNINQYGDHVSNHSLYGELPKVSSKITQRRLRLAGHAHRHPELTLNKLILWKPSHGHTISITNRGRPYLTLLDNLKADTGLKSAVDEIARLMEDRKLWRTVVNGSREHYPP